MTNSQLQGFHQPALVAGFFVLNDRIRQIGLPGDEPKPELCGAAQNRSNHVVSSTSGRDQMIRPVMLDAMGLDSRRFCVGVVVPQQAKPTRKMTP